MSQTAIGKRTFVNSATNNGSGIKSLEEENEKLKLE